MPHTAHWRCTVCACELGDVRRSGLVVGASGTIEDDAARAVNGYDTGSQISRTATNWSNWGSDQPQCPLPTPWLQW